MPSHHPKKRDLKIQGHFDPPIALPFAIRNDHNVEGIAKAMAWRTLASVSPTMPLRNVDGSSGGRPRRPWP